MFDQLLLVIYNIFRHRGGGRISWVESYFGGKRMNSPNIDDFRNELDIYSAFFAGENRLRLEEIYRELLGGMKSVPYEQCENNLEALDFIQEISATALWKYQIIVGELIEEFVRDFDRLDIQSERLRLYEKVQS